MLMDHGSPWWSTTNALGLTWLSVALIKQDIRLVLSGVGHPQTQGKVERFHGSLAWALRHLGTPQDLAGSAAFLETVRRDYNELRPHESLGMEVPDRHYRPSPRAYNPTPPPWDYSAGVRVLGTVWKTLTGPHDDKADDPQGPKGLAQLVVAGGQPAGVLQPVDHAFHHVAGLEQGAVEGAAPMLILAPRDGDADAPSPEVAADVGVAVALVPHHPSGTPLGASPLRALHRAPLQEGLEHRGLVLLARRQEDRHRQAVVLATKVHLGGKPASTPT